MRVTIVGSGTAAPEPDRACSGYFVEHDDTRLLLDCGPGVVHHLARFELPWQRLDHVFITHFHNDHTGDLPMLLFARKWGGGPPRSEPLHLWGPRGLRERLRAMAAAFGDHVVDPGFPLVIRELAPGDEVAVGGVGVRAAKTVHTDESLCYRLETPGASFGYTGDTGPSDAVAAFMAGVDLLLSECSVPDDVEMDTHLTPRGLAALAGAAAPGRLLVTHVYPQLDRQDVLGRIRAAGWHGPTLRAADGAVHDVDGTTPQV
jgi:ribonuclease BN (tRNA processing enzyme)